MPHLPKRISAVIDGETFTFSPEKAAARLVTILHEVEVPADGSMVTISIKGTDTIAVFHRFADAPNVVVAEICYKTVVFETLILGAHVHLDRLDGEDAVAVIWLRVQKTLMALATGQVVKHSYLLPSRMKQMKQRREPSVSLLAHYDANPAGG